MRAPFQILSVPYHFIKGELCFCVFHRADFDVWQFIAGGGEDNKKKRFRQPCAKSRKKPA